LSDDILYEVRDGIGRITFNRPQARNAFTFAMYERLAEICREASKDKSLRVLLMTGAGDKAFASGTDIAQFKTFDKPQDALDYEVRIERTLGAIEGCPLPTIAAIRGACTGGGAAIAIACDLRIAATTARFGFPLARTLGNCLAPGNYARLLALVGAGRVKDMLFTARLIEGPEAHAIGLVTEVVADPSRLMARAEEVARIVASHAPLTLKATKEALRRLMARIPAGEGNDLLLMCYMSKDFREGVDAFLGKRPPKFTGA
jgi:enoyl-CoA hydratase